MPNLEELIKIREEAIKKQEQVLEIIENKGIFKNKSYNFS